MSLDNYVDVATRLLLLREKYPDARVVVDIVVDQPDRVVTRSTIFLSADPDAPPAAVDYAAEWPSNDRRDGPAGQGFALETCSTSSTGRAIGLLGIGIARGHRASAEEIEAAERRSAAAARDAEVIEAVWNRLKAAGGNDEHAAALKRLAADHDQKLTKKAIATFPEWRAHVIELLDLVEADAGYGTVVEEVDQ